MKFDFIIAHHNENNYRERNLNEILKYYLEIIREDTNIIIVEQNTTTKLDVEDPRIIRIYEKYETEYFWKSKLLNRGIKESSKEAFCVVDSDAVISKEAIDYLYENEFTMIFPYTDVKMLNEGQTRLWIKNRKTPILTNRDSKKFHLCYTGFFMAMSRQNYEDINGYDEEYIGWGGEDDAVVIKTKRINKVDKMQVDSLVMHLYHPRKDNSEYTESKRYKSNQFFTHALKTMSLDKFNKYITGETTLETIVSENKINSESLIKKIFINNGDQFTEIPITGVYPFPDDENGNFSDFTLFKGLYMLVKKNAFINNIQRLVDASNDNDEKISILKLVDQTIKYFEENEE